MSLLNTHAPLPSYINNTNVFQCYQKGKTNDSHIDLIETKSI